MNRKKIRKLAFIAVVLCVTSMPCVSAYSAEKNSSNSEQSEQVEIKSNWLTRLIAEQLNKDVKKLTIDDLKGIKKLDLKSEKIENSIPDTIGLLENLEYLNLNRCKIDGKVPKELAKLSKLKHLDLGDNHISEIPKELEDKIIDGDYTYCDVEGNEFTLNRGWHYLKGNWCYLTRYGERLTGEQRIDKVKYEFSDDGVLLSGKDAPIQSNESVGWIQKDGKWYYNVENGNYLKDSWQNINNKWYYFDKDGVMLTGLRSINGKAYYLSDNGDMKTGWQNINGIWYYFSSGGDMFHGWISLDNKIYYLDEKSGAMACGTTRNIDGKMYTFNASGEMVNNVSGSSSYNPNIDSSCAHSTLNYNLFKYMSYDENQRSVDVEAVRLHGGDTSNNCVFFLSEALRRIGVNIPKTMANTVDFEYELKSRGFVYSYDLSQLKPGDIVFTNNYTHVYIFMGWDTDGYGYIVDNQGNTYGGILHRRNIYNDTYISDRATHFFYYPN